jgi:[ribosomal protein S5]-alanine N-acetyltransferase
VFAEQPTLAAGRPVQQMVAFPRRRCQAEDPLVWLAVPTVRLRRWRMADLDRVARMTNDEYLRPWWWMADDLEAWLRREIAEERGPSRAICLPDDDRALGRVAVRLPESASEAVRCDAVRTRDQPAGELSYWLLPEARGRGLAFTAVTEMTKIAADLGLKSLVLDIEEENAASIRVAEHLGAERRSPTRRHTDRFGEDWTMVVYLLSVR